MKYYILQFKFLTPVHFGTAENKKSGNLQSFNCCADTFFSALVTETAALDGELCSRFIEAVQKGGLLFSDFLPYYSGAEEELYVPVPYNCKEKVNPLDLQLSFKELCLQYEALRDHENMAYIRVSGIYDYLHPYESTAKEQEKHDFGWSGIQRRLDFRNGGRAYYVSNYTFAEGAGLYCIVGLDDETLLEGLVKAVELLGLSGIGGRRSSGFGKFVLKGAPQPLSEDCGGDAGMLKVLLENKTSSLQMSLSVLCPVQEQIATVKKGAFSLLKRSSVYMLKAGSCFPERVEGRLLEFAALGAQHAVYRYGKAVYMGLPV